jgi:short-subunit dehydrogenase
MNVIVKKRCANVLINNKGFDKSQSVDENEEEEEEEEEEEVIKL